jgi:hypothetical protein
MRRCPVPPDVSPADRVKVLAALEGAARIPRARIHREVFSCERSKAELDALGAALESEGRIHRVRRAPGGGRERRPTEEWAIIKMGSMTPVNGSSAAVMEGPPPGEGWLPKAATLKKARRGVMPAHAARVGQRVRRNEQARQKGTGTGKPAASDEQRGATHLITEAVNTYRRQGILEVQGDWIRLVMNPTRRPPHHWHEALLHFLAEGHPTLDGKWHPKPTTLTGAWEEALGRKLEPWERALRRPGHAGTWDPEHILLFDFAADTITTLAETRGT